jgi:hypothetical protein
MNAIAAECTVKRHHPEWSNVSCCPLLYTLYSIPFSNPHLLSPRLPRRSDPIPLVTTLHTFYAHALIAHKISFHIPASPKIPSTPPQARILSFLIKCDESHHTGFTY